MRSTTTVWPDLLRPQIPCWYTAFMDCILFGFAKFWVGVGVLRTRAWNAGREEAARFCERVDSGNEWRGTPPTVDGLPFLNYKPHLYHYIPILLSEMQGSLDVLVCIWHPFHCRDFELDFIDFISHFSLLINYVGKDFLWLHWLQKRQVSGIHQEWIPWRTRSALRSVAPFRNFQLQKRYSEWSNPHRLPN